MINIVKTDVSERYNNLPIMICEKIEDNYTFVNIDEVDNTKGHLWHHYFFDHERSIRTPGSVAKLWDSKFYQYTKLYGAVPLPRFKLYENSFSLIKDLSNWNCDLMITSEYGDGGESFLFFEKGRKPGAIFKKFGNNRVRASEYIADADSISVHLVISKHGLYISPAVKQHIENKTIYSGGNFPYKEPYALYSICEKVADKLLSSGYKGICHVDFLVRGNGVFLCELNPRIAVSTPLIAYTLENIGINLPFLEYCAVVHESVPDVSIIFDSSLHWDFKIKRDKIPLGCNEITHTDLREKFRVPDGNRYHLNMFNGRFAEIVINDKEINLK